MSFTPEQVAELSAPLSKAHVKKNPRGFDYVEAYHAENEANRIFGFDAWDRETELTLISEVVVGDKHRVYYRAKVRITVRTPGGGVVVREGCGYGSGIDKDLGQAHESALKESESDAEKRALKTFGNPFGQALYDKTQANVVDEPAAPVVPVEERGLFIACKAAIDLAQDEAALHGWTKDNEASLAKIKDQDTEVYYAILDYWKKRLREFRQRKAAA